MSEVNELYHYGRLGMKWGRHIYRNKYGLITDAGRARTKELEAEYDTLTSNTKMLTPKGIRRKTQLAEEYKKITGKSISSKRTMEKEQKKDTTTDLNDDNKPKKLEDMTNEELQAHNTRKQLENTYLSLQPKPGIPDGKKMQDMTNEELQAYNARKQLETAYLNYQPKSEPSKAKKFISSVMSKVIAPVVIKAGQAYLTKLMDDAKAAKKTADEAKKAAEEATKKASEVAKKSAASESAKKAAEEAIKTMQRAAEEASKKSLLLP